MLKYSGYVNTVDGEKFDDRVNIVTKPCENGVNAVYINAISQNDACGFKNFSLDSECGACIDVSLPEEVCEYMADYLDSEFWCKPDFGSDLKDVPDDTQLLIAKKKNGEYLVFVPVVNDKYKCVFCGNDKNTVTAKLFSWCDGLYDCRGLAFLWAEGENPLKLVENCVKAALEILNNGTRHISQRRYPEVFDYLGWCSWDSMQIRVSDDGIIKKCEEFKKKNIPVKWVIIDDMWAEIRDFYGQTYSDKLDMIWLMHRSALYSFEADPIRFPDGLKKCIDKIKKFGMSVGIWHPTTGYWRGIDPDGKAYELLKDYLIKSDVGVIVPDWHKANSYMYYKTFHDFFYKCGLDFVKIDNQSMSRRYYKNYAPIGKVAKEYHDGMEASVGEHFDNKMINCMGMASEDMWSRSVSPLSRCSGDFKPDNKEWFSHHITQCAYNSILQGQFYWCDWDMWWTDDGQAGKNSLMRAISGGPVYISDMHDRTNKDVLDPLCLDNGRILRCDKPCTPTRDLITTNPFESEAAFKLQNTVGEYGIMAVVNINRENKKVSAKICGELIDGFDADEYAVYEYYSRDLKILKKGESFDVSLNSDEDYKFYIFAPITNGFAAIGRIDKYISPKTIKYVHNETVVLLEDGPFAYVKDGKLVIKESMGNN